LQWQEITPVFCDVDPKTFTIDPEHVERMITPRTTAILGVHLWGRVCNVRALESIARRRRLKLVFDAAHAFGCSHDGVMVGNFGDAEVLSFHATKFLNTLEGGAVTTNDDALAAKIRLMKNFGFSGYDKVVYIGTNGKMNEISAAMGLTGLESMDEFIETNRRNYSVYARRFDAIPGVEMACVKDDERNNYQYVIAEIDDTITGISRDNVVKALHAENVLVRRYFYPGCHEMEPYRSYFPHAGLLLPRTKRISERVISFPTGTSVSAEDIGEICALVKLCVENGPELTCRMRTLRAD
jgi:dTDP-4-amino-4,6-dideoxygalactose transaminase